MVSDITVLTLSLYLCLGALAGIIGGMMGLGGGIVIVPALVYLFHAQDFSPQHLMHVAVATSLTTIIFTSISSARSHHRRGAVMWREVIQLVPGIIAGAILGAIIADRLPSELLRRAFGVFEIAVAMQIGFGLKPRPERVLPETAGMLASGTIIGSVSTILGIGGGTLTVPFLMWCNTDIRKAVATSAACGLPIALAGSGSMMVTGMDNTMLPPYSTGYVYWPAAAMIALASVMFAPLGARLAHTLPVMTLKRIFSVFLLFIGIRMVM